MTNIRPEQIVRIKEAIDLAQVVGQYVRLRPSGANRYMGLCPFHREKTPSFTVHREGFFKCFSCGAKGDAINFVQMIERVSFPVAARRLADDFGVLIDEEETGPQRADAAVLTAGAESWWAAMRETFVKWQRYVRECEQRATAFLAARVNELDGHGIEYAWWWMVNACELWGWLQGLLDMIDAMSGRERVDAYLRAGDLVRLRHEARLSEVAAEMREFREEMMEAIKWGPVMWARRCGRMEVARG